MPNHPSVEKAKNILLAHASSAEVMIFRVMHYRPVYKRPKKIPQYGDSKNINLK
jgi:hypothetical protein